MNIAPSFGSNNGVGLGQRTTRIVLVDDHAVLRDSLSQVLQVDPHLKVVGTACDGNSGFDLLLKEKPDIAMLDIEMPGRTCFDVVSASRDLLPNTRFMLLSGFFSDQYIMMAKKLKVAAYVTKDEAATQVVAAVHLVAAGKEYFSPAISDRLRAAENARPMFDQEAVPLDTLSIREKEVLIHLAKGASIKEVAGILSLSRKTVDNHTQRLMAKLDIHTRADLVRYAIRERLVQA